MGLLAIGALQLERRKTGMRRDYEALYSLGVTFAAYASAEALSGGWDTWQAAELPIEKKPSLDV